LSEVEVADVAQKVIDYIARRVSNQGGGPSITLQGQATAQLNAELFDWVMENLIKNALDALDPSRPGVIQVSISTVDRFVFVDVSDNGRGMERSQFADVFRPGYSTKKRGWGLGLSLSRRIIRDYHKGIIAVLRSKVGEGTTIRVSLPR
jgi:signal transduction histidine kinase